MPQTGVRLRKPTILQVAKPQELRNVIFRCHVKPSVEEGFYISHGIAACNKDFLYLKTTQNSLSHPER